MKNLTFFFAVCLLSFTTTFAQSSKTYDLDDFNAIAISNAADVVFTQGPQSVVVSGPQVLIDRLELEVKNKSLNISSKQGNWDDWNKDGGLTFQISAVNLKALAISGSSDFAFEGPFKADGFSLTVSGSGDVTTENDILLGVSNMVISGNGDVELRGTCQKLTLVNSGNGDLEADDLVIQNANVVNSGNGDVEINVTEKIFTDLFFIIFW